MTTSMDDQQPAPSFGRFSRRRAVGAIAASSLAASLTVRSTTAEQPQDLGASTQLNPDGTTPFNYRLGASEPMTYAAGTIRAATIREMPRIEALSIQLIEIAPGGVREVHWHPNAAEINCVLAGKGIVGILSTSGENAMNAIETGTSTFIAKGDAHFIENTGSIPLTLLIGFSTADPEHISVSQALPWVPADIIEQVLDVPIGSLPPLPPRGDLAIVPLAGHQSTIMDEPPSPYSVALDALPESRFGGGTVQALRTDLIASLAEMTLLRLVIEVGAVREPHWHGNAAEFNYCVEGTGQIGIVAPSGESWTFVVNAGDVAFIPSNWFHYIANVGDDSLILLAFFDDVAPNRIDLSTMTQFFPSQVMASSLEITPDAFANLPAEGTVVIAPARDDPESDPTATPAP